MKTFTTLTAVAALIAGMSFANAQNSGGSNSTTNSPASINAGTPTDTGPSQSGAESKGAADSSGGGRQAKSNVTGNSRFCIPDAAGSNGLNCKFTTMAACEQEAKTEHRQCQPNPNQAGTTGMK